MPGARVTTGPRMPDASRIPGPQPARTALSWQRTLLSVAAVSVLIGFGAVRLESPVMGVLSATLILASGGLMFGLRAQSTWRSLVRTMWLVAALGLAGVGLALQKLTGS